MSKDSSKNKIFVVVAIVLALLLSYIIQAYIIATSGWVLYLVYIVLFVFYIYVLYLSYTLVSKGEIARAYFFAVGLFFVFALSFVGACAIGSFDLNINPPR